MNLRHARVLTALIILSIALVISFSAQETRAAGAALVWVDPPEKSVNPGEVFEISIRIDDIPSPGVAGVQVVLRWDPSVLTGLNTTEVLFNSVTTTEEQKANIWTIEHRVNNTYGFMFYAVAFQDTPLAVSEGYGPIMGNHTIATVTLRGINTGRTTLELATVKLGDVNGDEVPWIKAEGIVTVGNPPPTIMITSPGNETYYNRSSVNLVFTLSKPVAWIGYSLDEHPNITILGDTELQTVDGLHSLVVYANDTQGRMGNSSKMYFVVDTLSPVALFTYDPSTPEAEVYHSNFRWSFTFNGSVSTDATTFIVSYHWDLGDGASSTDASLHHTYFEPRTYVVRLTVTDYVGHSTTQEKTITINPASKPLDIPYMLVILIAIPVAWVPALVYYFNRTKRTRATRRKA